VALEEIESSSSMEYLGKKMKKFEGWPSPWSPARKRWRRWWGNSSAMSSSDPPVNSNKIQLI
jgi:hypothetical protein